MNKEKVVLPLETPDKVRFITQQGFSQHTFEMTKEDAKTFTSLLDKYKHWYAIKG